MSVDSLTTNGCPGPNRAWEAMPAHMLHSIKTQLWMWRVTVLNYHEYWNADPSEFFLTGGLLPMLEACVVPPFMKLPCLLLKNFIHVNKCSRRKAHINPHNAHHKTLRCKWHNHCNDAGIFDMHQIVAWARAGNIKIFIPGKPTAEQVVKRNRGIPSTTTLAFDWSNVALNRF